MTSLSRPNRKGLYGLSVLLLFCFYMLWPVNFYLAETIKGTYYMMAVPVLTAGVLYFRRLRDGREAQLLLAYWLWFWLTRVLNGSPALQHDFQLTFDLGLMFPLFVLGLSLDRDGRRRFLNWFSALVGGYHFLLAVICLYAFMTHRLLINPITEGSLGMQGVTGFQRINILDTNPDATSYWFMMSLFLMVYQFFACRRKLWRVPILLSALLDVLVISITFTRSVMLAVSVGFGLLAALLLRQALRGRGTWLRAVGALLALLLVVPLCYKGFSLCGDGLSRLSFRLFPVEQSAPPEAEAASESPAVQEEQPVLSSAEARSTYVVHASQLGGLLGKLDDLSTLRLTVWRSAFLALRLKPSVLWKGQLTQDTMALSNPFTPHNPPHYHNALIQVLMTTGLPGLGLILALLVLTVLGCLRLLLSDALEATTAAKTLALPVAAALVYYLLEAGLFTDCDVRPLYYYIMSGMALGFARDLGR